MVEQPLSNPFEHHVNGVNIVHFKLTDCFILHDAMTIKNELEAGNIKLQSAAVVQHQLG